MWCVCHASMAQLLTFFASLLCGDISQHYRLAGISTWGTRFPRVPRQPNYHRGQCQNITRVGWSRSATESSTGAVMYASPPPTHTHLCMRPRWHRLLRIMIKHLFEGGPLAVGPIPISFRWGSEHLTLSSAGDVTPPVTSLRRSLYAAMLAGRE